MEKIYFIHIMKTGGTSFRKMLVGEFGRDAIFPNDRDLNDFPNRWYPTTQWMSDNIKSVREHQILLGHYPYSLKNQLTDYMSATVIRAPFQRTVSMLEHRRLRSSNNPDLTYEQLLDDEDFVSRQILNYQTKVLGMPLGEVNLRNTVDEETYRNARSNLEKLDFIGISESFSESCTLFDYKFGTNLANHIRHDNKGKNPPEISNEVRKKINNLIEMDSELYDLGLKKLKRELEEADLKNSGKDKK